jgi:hypothetical protein
MVREWGTQRGCNWVFRRAWWMAYPRDFDWAAWKVDRMETLMACARDFDWAAWKVDRMETLWRRWWRLKRGRER